MFHKRLLTAAAATTLLLSVQTASAADQVKMLFDWIPGGIHGAWYAGTGNGCFADRDLEFSFDRGSGSVDTVAKVASGLGDVGMADFGTLMLGVKNNDAPVKALMPIYSDSPFGIMTLESTGVEAVTDLEGRKLASGPGDAAILMLPLAMGEAGGDIGKVETEKADFSALLGLLLQGKIDGHTTFLTTASVLSAVVENAGKSPKFIHFGKDLNMYGSVLFANEQFLAERPDVAKRAVEAVQCVLTAARDNPDAAVDALVSAFPEKKRAAELAAINGGIKLIFGSDAYQANGFDWDAGRTKTTFDNTMRSQGASETFGAPSDFIHAFE